MFTSTDGRGYEFQQVLAGSSPDGVYSYEDPRVQRVRSGGDEQIVMSYTNLPAPESGLPWRVGVHRLPTRTAASASTPPRAVSSGRTG